MSTAAARRLLRAGGDYDLSTAALPGQDAERPPKRQNGANPMTATHRVLALAALLAGTCSAAAMAASLDPLEARIEARDAARFAAVFQASGGRPSAAQLQAGYLDGAGRGVAIFTPGRIEGAAHLAAFVAKEPERYRYAIETCLPLLPTLAPDLRAIYLAYRGLAPNHPLPAIHVVFGAGNSGGTAEADAQVLGLEVMCGPGTTPEAFRASMRSIFAHETVHSWQPAPTPAAEADFLLLTALQEGVPDLLASLVTGEVPQPSRDRWAREREAWLWQEFQRDRAAVRSGIQPGGALTPAARQALHRWFGNYRKAPEGWPYEAGYWVGMRIAAAYLDRSPNKAAAIETLIQARDPAAILSASGYAPTAPR